MVFRQPGLRIVAVAGFYALAAAICTFPLILYLADHLLAPPDTQLETWILAWDVHALGSDPWHLYDANIYFPFPLPLTYSDAMLSGALLIAPVELLTGNPVLAHNLLTLAALVIAGLGTYLLVRTLTASDLSGVLAGCIFSLCAARQAHLEHVNLLQLGWLPLALWALHLALRRGRRDDLLLFGLFTTLQALASWYLAWMMAVCYVVFFLVEAVARWRRWPLRSVLGVAGALGLSLLIVVPVSWPYLRTQQLYQFTWPPDVLINLSAVPSDYLSVPFQNVVYRPLLAAFANPDFSNEHILFPGATAVLLGLVALVRRWPGLEVVRYALIGLVALVLSFGPLLPPYALLLQLVPGFSVMRVPARWDFLVMLALGVLAGFGLARLRAPLARRISPRRCRLVLAGLGGLALLELLPRPLSVVPVPVGPAVPPVYAWLRTQDPGAVVAEIPARGPGGFASFGYEYLSTYHWHPLVNGRSGFDPPASAQVFDVLDAFPDPTAVERLRSLGVRYLIAHQGQLDAAARQQLAGADLATLGLDIAARFGDDVVYGLAPRSMQAVRPDHLQQLELPALVSRDVTPTLTATLRNNTPYPLVVGAPQAIGADITWGQVTTTRSPLQTVPMFLDPQQTLTLHVPVPLAPRSPATGSVQMTVRLTGSVPFEASREVRIVDEHTSADRDGLAGRFEQVRLPPRVGAGARIPVEVVVRNTGQAVWLPEPPGQAGTHGAVGAGLRGWLDADGRPVLPVPDAKAHTWWPTSPDQTATLTLEIPTPPRPGHYTLVLGLVSEYVAWFDQFDSGSRTSVPVDVQPSVD